MGEVEMVEISAKLCNVLQSRISQCGTLGQCQLPDPGRAFHQVLEAEVAKVGTVRQVDNPE